MRKLQYGSPRTPGRRFPWAEWRKIITAVGLIAAPPFILSVSLNADYGLAGTLLFVVGALIFGRLFPWRLPHVFITSAIAGMLLAVTLYLVSSYQLVLENRSGQAIKWIQIICSSDSRSATGFSGSVPKDAKLSTTFHLLRFGGDVWVRGAFADGKAFKSASYSTAAGNSSYRNTRIVINSEHQVKITQD